MYKDEKLIEVMRDMVPLFGRFWYSKDQRRDHDRKGVDRFFCKLEDGTITEYTEMVDAADVIEDPTWVCEYDDAVCLGDGTFHHREECL